MERLTYMSLFSVMVILCIILLSYYSIHDFHIMNPGFKTSMQKSASTTGENNDIRMIPGGQGQTRSRGKTDIKTDSMHVEKIKDKGRILTVDRRMLEDRRLDSTLMADSTSRDASIEDIQSYSISIADSHARDTSVKDSPSVSTSIAESDFNARNASAGNAKNESRKQEIYYTKLRKMGLDSVEFHEFKSIYIQDPVIYHSSLTPKIPGNRKTKIISCFNCPPWYKAGGPAAYNRNFKRCPYSECYFDKDGEMQSKADVVFFFRSPKYMPKRPTGQIWAHCSWESPSSYTFTDNTQYEKWKGVFNWTIGYAGYNDFFHPNYILSWRAKQSMMSDKEYLQFATRKTKSAVWLVSNCNAPSNRDAYVREMQKYIDVDIFGSCGTMKCNSKSDCMSMLNNTYKFYLSFENAFCKDYVTEKFLKNFLGRTQILTVVRGGADYEKYFPPKTFINTRNFKNAKELALYLKALASDNPRYAQLLKEKDKLMTLGYKYDWCGFCQMLHTEVKHKIIPDIKKVTHKNGICWKANDVF